MAEEPLPDPSGDPPRRVGRRDGTTPPRSTLGWLLRPRALLARLRRLAATVHEVEARSLAGEARLAELESAFADRLAAEREGREREADAARDRDHTLAVRADGVERELGVLQNDLERLRSQWAASLTGRLDGLEGTIRATIAELERVRDRMVPSLSGRVDVLVDRLADELEELASLVERVVRREPLPLPSAEPAQSDLAAALAAVQPRLLAAFRGSEDEIRHRLERLLPRLADHGPVLDLGAGRGELLALLGEAGIAARGIEGDPALAGAARRRGLDVMEGDVTVALESQPGGAWGAVTAIHLFEHLSFSTRLGVLAEVRRVLRPGGILIVECPDPRTLRVGGSLFWLDPTHSRPLLPETLEIELAVSGFEIVERERLHPFPEEQRFRLRESRVAGGSAQLTALREEVDRVLGRLDELLNGPRDFALVARTAAGAPGAESDPH